MRHIFLSLIIILSLTACGEKELTLNQICDLSEGLCEKIKTDGMCKVLRKNIIISNYDIKTFNSKEKQKETKEILKYKLLNNLESYIKCAEKSSNIEYVDPKDKFAKQDIGRTTSITDKEKKERADYIVTLNKRKTDRNQNYHNAKIMLSDIEESIKNSNNEYLLYWQWSRMSSEKSIVKLLNLDKEGKLHNHNMLYFVSQEYIKYNNHYAINALLRALENYPSELYIPKEPTDKEILGVLTDEGRIHFNIFRTLISLSIKEKNYKQAYIYSKLLKLNKDNSVNLGHMRQIINSNEKNVDFDFLDSITKKVHESLEDGTFKKTNN